MKTSHLKFTLDTDKTWEFWQKQHQFYSETDKWVKERNVEIEIEIFQ